MEYEVVAITALIFGILSMIIGIIGLILNIATRISTHKMEFIPIDEKDVQDQKQMNKILNGIEEEEQYDTL